MSAVNMMEWAGRDVDTTAVDRRLSTLWKELASQSPTACPVRTHVFNLVVYTASRAEADWVSRRLKKLATRHPSRAILLIAQRESESTSLDAELSVECPPGTADRPSLCYERLILTAHGRAADHLSSIVIPLLMPQLPTYLWWRGQPPFGHRVLHRLLSVADQLVVDSGAFLSPGDGYAEIAWLCAGKQGVHDINWGRLTSWREIIAQFFDGAALLPWARSIREVHLECGAGEEAYQQATATSLLLLGWIASRLGWKPETTVDGVIKTGVTISLLQDERLIDVDVRLKARGEAATGQLLKVELICRNGAGEHARFAVQRSEDMQHAHVFMQIGDSQEITRVVPLQIGSEEELLADELETADHDSLYESVAEMASRIAGREVWSPA